MSGCKSMSPDLNIGGGAGTPATGGSRPAPTERLEVPLVRAPAHRRRSCLRHGRHGGQRPDPFHGGTGGTGPGGVPQDGIPATREHIRVSARIPGRASQWPVRRRRRPHRAEGAGAVQPYEMGTGSNAFAQNLASSFDFCSSSRLRTTINLIISTLSNMMSSNRNTASQASNNLEQPSRPPIHRLAQTGDLPGCWPQEFTRCRCPIAVPSGLPLQSWLFPYPHAPARRPASQSGPKRGTSGGVLPGPGAADRPAAVLARDGNSNRPGPNQRQSSLLNHRCLSSPSAQMDSRSPS